MKVKITFTHWGFFYGLPIYIGVLDDDPNGMVPLPMLPGMHWWITSIAPAIQAAQAWVCGALGIDSGVNGHFVIDRIRPLKKPFERVQDWPDDTKGRQEHEHDYRSQHH